MTEKKKVKQVDWKLSAIAVLCLTGIEIAAMSYGINGTLRTIIFGMIALIVGIQLPQFKI